MHYIVKRLGCLCRSVKSVKTDALILEISRKKASTVQAAICDIKFDQLHELRRKYELGSDPDQLFLNSHAEVSPISSNDPVFRFSEIGNTLMGNYSKPSRSVSHPEVVPPWCEYNDTAATLALLSGDSLLVVGAPGTGKSYYVRELVKTLRKKGKVVDIIAKTHAAVCNFGVGAQTADHFVRKHVRSGGRSEIGCPGRPGDHSNRGSNLGGHMQD